MSAADVVSLTDCKRPTEQIKWLAAHGWKFELGVSGKPKVAIDECILHMVSGVDKKQKKTQPDFSWMKESV